MPVLLILRPQVEGILWPEAQRQLRGLINSEQDRMRLKIMGEKNQIVPYWERSQIKSFLISALMKNLNEKKVSALYQTQKFKNKQMYTDLL